MLELVKNVNLKCDIEATILGFRKHGLRFFSLFVPAGCPLPLLPLLVLREFISYLARNVSLGLYYPAKPHAFTSLPLQSSFIKFITGKISITGFSISVLIPLALNVGLYLGYKTPIRFMLVQLDLAQFYPLFATVIVLCSLLILANLKNESVKPMQLYKAVFFALFIPFFILFYGGHYNETYAFIHCFFAQLPLVSSELKQL